MSGQTVTAASTDVITDQDYYNVIFNGIAQGGGTFNGFSINFATISAIPVSAVSAVNNYMTGESSKYPVRHNPRVYAEALHLCRPRYGFRVSRNCQ